MPELEPIPVLEPSLDLKVYISARALIRTNTVPARLLDICLTVDGLVLASKSNESFGD